MNAYRAYDVIEERKGRANAQRREAKWIDDRAQEIIDALPKEPSGLFRFSANGQKPIRRPPQRCSWRGI